MENDSPQLSLQGWYEDWHDFSLTIAWNKYLCHCPIHLNYQYILSLLIFSPITSLLTPNTIQSRTDESVTNLKWTR